MSKKGESIYKRKDSRWEARYIKGYRFDGAPKYGYCYGKTYREAKQKAAIAKVNLAMGKAEPVAKEKKLFSVYCDEWLQLCRSRVKESTYVKYYGIIEKHIKPRLGKHQTGALTTLLIEQFSYELLDEEGLSEKTVKDVLTVLNSVIRHAAKSIPQLLSAVEIVYPKVPKNETRVLSKEEQKRFVAYLLNCMDECKFGALLSLLTGMRIGEICALKWKNISVAEGTVTVQSTIQRLRVLDREEPKRTKIVISDPKSSTSARTIPLTDYTVKLCKTQWCGDPEAFVLTGEQGRYIEPRSMQYKLKRYAEDCGLEGVHFHTLRHTFATRCVEVDFEIKSLSEILGHSNSRVTLERYVHSSMELKRSNMNKLSFLGC